MPNSGHDFPDLLARARQGDESAFAELIAPLEADLRGMAHRRLTSLRARVDTDDVQQQTLHAAWRALAQLREESEVSFRVWLMAIHRATIDKAWRREHQKKRSLKRESPLASGSASGPTSPFGTMGDREPSPSRNARGQERREVLLAHLARLKEEYRLVLCMQFLEELPYSEMMVRTGLTAGQLQGRLRRAQATLLKQSGSELIKLLSGPT